MKTYNFSTYYQGIEYTTLTHGYYFAFLDLARQIAELNGCVPLQLEIESEFGTKTLTLTIEKL